MAGVEAVVSVITPAYNAASFVESTIRSVLRQGEVVAEHVIVDDGSTDLTGEIAESLHMEDDRVRLLRQANSGVAASRNRGYQMASPGTEFVLFLDADDILRAGALDQLVNRLRHHPGWVAAHGASGRIDRVGKVLPDATNWELRQGRLEPVGGRWRGWSASRRPLPSDSPTSILSLAYRNPITTPGQLLIRRTVFDRTNGFRAEFTPAEDWDLLLQLAMLGPIGYVDAHVLDYRRHPTGASLDLQRMRRAELGVRQAWASAVTVTPGERAVLLRGSVSYELDRAVDRLSIARSDILGQRWLEGGRNTVRGAASLRHAASFALKRLLRRRPSSFARMPRSITHVAVTYRYAGTERIILDLVDHGMRAGWTENVIVPPHAALDDFVTDLETAGAVVHRIGPLFESERRPLSNLWKLTRCFQRDRPDVVHMHFPWAPTCFEVVLAAWIARVPLRIRTEHNPIVDRLGFKQRIKLALLDLLVHQIVCVSSQNAERHVRNGARPRDKITVVPNGIRPVPALSCRPDVRRELELPADQLLVIHVGALEPRKGALDLVRSAVALRHRNDTTILIVGDGPLRPEVEAAIRRDELGERIRMLGQRQDVDRLMSASDIYVQSSHFEGLSIAMLEALSHGLPMVTTDVDGVRDVVGDSDIALVVPISDPDALSAALLTLLDAHELRSELGAEGKARVVHDFTTEGMFLGYRRIIEPQRPSAPGLCSPGPEAR